MQFKAVLFVASLISATVAVPTTQDADVKAVVNTRFATYEAEKRDDNGKKAVVNSRFATYEPQKRGADANEAVVNSRFATYENEARDLTDEGKVKVNLASAACDPMSRGTDV